MTARQNDDWMYQFTTDDCQCQHRKNTWFLRIHFFFHIFSLTIARVLLLSPAQFVPRSSQTTQRRHFQCSQNIYTVTAEEKNRESRDILYNIDIFVTLTRHCTTRRANDSSLNTLKRCFVVISPKTLTFFFLFSNAKNKH